MSKKNRRILDQKGPPCHRLTQVREHERITDKLRSQPFYYARWYRCMNQNCRTTLIMPPEFMVHNEAAEPAQEPIITPPHCRGDIVLEVLARSGGRPPWE